MRRNARSLLAAVPALVFLLAFALFWVGVPAETAYPAEGGQKYSDVASSDENYKYIRYLSDRGLINGYPDGTFGPLFPMTRAEAAKITVQLRGLELLQPQVQTFSDVGPEHWAYPYVESATVAGLFFGNPDGAFHPEEVLTRAEIALLLERMAGEKDAGPDAALPADVPAWAASAASAMVDAGLLGTDQDNLYHPDWAITRGEFARATALLTTLSEQYRRTALRAELEPLQGDVYLARPGGDPGRLSSVVSLKEGVVISTGETGQGRIRFEDGSGVLLEGSSELEVVKLQGTLFIKSDGTPGSAVDGLEVRLIKGKMFGALASVAQNESTGRLNLAAGFPVLAMAGSSNALLRNDQVLAAANDTALPWWKRPFQKRVRVKVDMPWSVAGIRGTFWKNDTTGDDDSTSVLYGEAELSAAGSTVVVTAGLETRADRGASPDKPAPLSAKEKEEWAKQDKWVTEEVERIKEQAPKKPEALEPPKPLLSGKEEKQPPAAPGQEKDKLKEQEKGKVEGQGSGSEAKGNTGGESKGNASDEPKGNASDEPKGNASDEPKGNASDEPKGNSNDKSKGKDKGTGYLDNVIRMLEWVKMEGGNIKQALGGPTS